MDAEELPDEIGGGTFKIGKLLSTSLTADGVEYVKEAIREGGIVAEYWRQVFSAGGYDLGLPDEDEEE